MAGNPVLGDIDQARNIVNSVNGIQIVRTVSGSPTVGRFYAGDICTDQAGALYVCSVSGNPGTWLTK